MNDFSIFTPQHPLSAGEPKPSNAEDFDLNVYAMARQNLLALASPESLALMNQPITIVMHPAQYERWQQFQRIYTEAGRLQARMPDVSYALLKRLAYRRVTGNREELTNDVMEGR